MRERDEAQRGGEEVGGEGRWRGWRELRREGGGTKQERREEGREAERRDGEVEVGRGQNDLMKSRKPVESRLFS